MCANEKKNLVGHPFFKLHTTLVADVETPYIDHLGWVPLSLATEPSKTKASLRSHILEPRRMKRLTTNVPCSPKLKRNLQFVENQEIFIDVVSVSSLVLKHTNTHTNACPTSSKFPLCDGTNFPALSNAASDGLFEVKRVLQKAQTFWRFWLQKTAH